MLLKGTTECNPRDQQLSSSSCTKTLSHTTNWDVHDHLSNVPPAGLLNLKRATDCEDCNLLLTVLSVVKTFLKHATTSDALGQQLIGIYGPFLLLEIEFSSVFYNFLDTVKKSCTYVAICKWQSKL